MKKVEGLSKIFIIVVMILSLLGGVVGCKTQERPTPEAKRDKEKIPASLRNMDEGIHSMISQLESIEEVTKVKPEDVIPEQKENKEDKEQEAGQEQSQQQGEEQAQEALSQGESPQQEQIREEMETDRKKQAQVMEKWEKSKKDLKSIHEAWNEYGAVLGKEGVDNSKITEMEGALHDLTTYIEEENRDKALYQANNVILAISNFMETYKGNADGVLGKMEYLARQCYLDAQEGNWFQAKSRIESKEDYMNILRQIAEIPEKQKPLIEKLRLSLEDLEKAIYSKNLPLLRIKKEIAIKNLEDIKGELK